MQSVQLTFPVMCVLDFLPSQATLCTVQCNFWPISREKEQIGLQLNAITWIHTKALWIWYSIFQCDCSDLSLLNKFGRTSCKSRGGVGQQGWCIQQQGWCIQSPSVIAPPLSPASLYRPTKQFHTRLNTAVGAWNSSCTSDRLRASRVTNNRQRHTHTHIYTYTHTHTLTHTCMHIHRST